MEPDLTAIQRLRFERRIIKGPGCWTWTGVTNAGGAGRVKLNGKLHCAHRIAYHLYVGPIMKPLIVRHKCDNSACLNPDHMELGTTADNMRDMAERGRSRNVPRPGESSNFSKLTEGQAKEIINLLAEGRLTHASIAFKYRVNRATVSQINRGANWKHLNKEIS